MKHPVAAASFLFLIAWPFVSVAQCSKDTDCRGTRICEQGKCIVDTSNSDDEPPPRNRRQGNSRPYDSSPAQFCATNFGSCGMAVAIPKGSSCYCPTPYGPVGGVAR